MEGRGRCDDGLDPRELERQYRAIQKSIESHLDRQLGQLRSQPKLGRSEASEGWYRRWKPEIFAAVLLVLGALAGLRPQSATGPSQHEFVAHSAATPFGSVAVGPELGSDARGG